MPICKCGAPVPPRKRYSPGRPATYCSEKCRLGLQWAARALERKTARQAARQVERYCTTCGAAFQLSAKGRPAEKCPQHRARAKTPAP